MGLDVAGALIPFATGLGRGAAAARRLCSFDGSTLVLTQAGPQPISAIREGDYVLAQDVASGESGYHRVNQTFVHEDGPLLEVVVRSAGGRETIAVTGEHPFAARDGGWVPAADLVSGDEIQTAAGDWALVESTRWTDRTTLVYNLEVEGAHTFFVGEGGLWVHNACLLERALTQADLGLQGTDAIVEGTFRLMSDGRAVAYVEYLGSPARDLGIRGIRALDALKQTALDHGAGALRVETSRIIEESGTLVRALERRGFSARGNGTFWADFIL